MSSYPFERDEAGNVTLHSALVERYEERAQARAETVWLMSRAPHDGRPPMARTVSPIGVANAQEVRGAQRWRKTGKLARQHGLDGWACMRSFDGGATWEAMPQAVRAERKSVKRAAKTDHAGSYEALIAAVGVAQAD
jgi:hypothetical protein